MSTVPVVVDRNATSNAASVITTPPVRIGGMDFSVQTRAPAALAQIQISHDGEVWNTAATGLGDAMTAVTTRPLWARGGIAVDAGAPQIFRFRFVIRKEAGS